MIFSLKYWVHWVTDEISEISLIIWMYKFDIPDLHSFFLFFVPVQHKIFFNVHLNLNIIVNLIYFIIYIIWNYVLVICIWFPRSLGVILIGHKRASKKILFYNHPIIHWQNCSTINDVGQLIRWRLKCEWRSYFIHTAKRRLEE